MYLYLKDLHIIFVVTWFAGLFYMPRLFIYNIEAGEKEPAATAVLRQQFGIMIKRLWLGITWPSAIITLIFGLSLLFSPDYQWYRIVFEPGGTWLLIKLLFVIGLYAYHLSLHILYKQQQKGIFKYSSMQMRIWNEVATIFLVGIVTLVVVKESLSFVWAIIGFAAFIFVLLTAIRIYKMLRQKKSA